MTTPNTRMSPTTSTVPPSDTRALPLRLKSFSASHQAARALQQAKSLTSSNDVRAPRIAGRKRAAAAENALSLQQPHEPSSPRQLPPPRRTDAEVAFERHRQAAIHRDAERAAKDSRDTHVKRFNDVLARRSDYNSVPKVSPA